MEQKKGGVMNALERKMVDTLKDLQENHHVIGVKAEFEAEGTRLEEALRLKDVCLKAGLGLTIKIGGGEAVRDMYECRVIGVERIVGPMIESPYALHKFLAAAKLAFPLDELEDVAFAINVETVTAYQAFDQMLATPDIAMLNGIVIGRVDLTGSLGMGRDDINDPRILEIASEIFSKAKAKSLVCAMGGGVSAQALPFMRQLSGLDYFETRKVLFRCPGALGDDGGAGILKAVGFELLWLKNKRDLYSMIAREDEQRIGMLEYRYKQAIEAAGGKYE
jgi:4-hydroxy-2-oxoheptanedioate aldolase